MLYKGTNLKPESGQIVGRIVKVSRVGMFYKTWEAQLIPGGLNQSSGATGREPFNFTIEDPEMVAKVQECFANRTEAVIDYEVEALYLMFRSSNKGVFLTNISSENTDEIPETEQTTQ